jgi:chromosome segregation ATPase
LKEVWNSLIITVVNDQNTDEMNGKRPFEERVFARFDVVDARFNAVETRFDTVDSAIRNMDSRLKVLEGRAADTNSRLQKLEIRAYDTKPIWEQAIKEIVETRRELSKRLDRIDAMALETRADLRDAEDRLDKIERKPIQ